ncbi:MAG: porin, partial [Flammeovirgaceae bacterium]
MVKALLLSIILMLCHVFQLYSQGSTEYGAGLKLALDAKGEKYIRFVTWNQMWFRYMENNPGSMINGEEQNETWDISARRIRVLMYAQISPRYLIITHFGINNQTFANGGGSGTADTGPYGSGKKPQLFFHDAWNEYAIIPAKDLETGKLRKYNLYLGGGLHYWWGISRLTSASTLNSLMIDGPIVNWPLVELSDQFVRQFGVYTKGQLGKINYSLALNKPFATNRQPEVDPVKNVRIAVDNNGDPAPAITGYFDYHLFEQESNALPYRVGTYVGTKKVLNFGAGFYHQNNGTRSINQAGEIAKHNITLLGVDLF